MEPDLFTAAAEERQEKDPAGSPLAVRMRPRTLDEVVGQQHLLKPGSPLRRLVDRYAGEVCVALCAKQPVPAWALAALSSLPATMLASGHRARQYEKAVLDLAEAEVLSARVGETFAGAIVEVAAGDPRKGVVIVRAPAIEAGVSGASALPLGADVEVRLVEADPATRTTRFELAE